MAKNSWLTFDRRTLGLTRLLLGFYLLCDLLRRTFDWEAMYSDKGVLPSYFILQRPQSNGFSLWHGFVTPAELWPLWFVVFATYFCLFIGYRTRLMQVLSLVFVTSMNGRVLLIENGGYVVQNLLLLWTCFMPLGDRFSVDALRASFRRKRERTVDELNDRSGLIEEHRLKPYVSLVGIAVCLQLAAIYYFNVVHKFGPDWKQNFTAVHYVMYVDRMVTPIIGATREFVPPVVWKLMTMTVISAEALIPFCTLLPQLSIFGFDVKLWLKRFGLTLINFLHIGFGSTFVLGPFAWALCVFSALLFSYEDWEVTIKAMRRTHRARLVVLDPRSGAAHLAARLLVRLDRFGLLSFTAAEGDKERAARLAVRGPNGELWTGARALAEIIAALPIGPVFAWMLRLPPLSSALDAIMRALPGKGSRWLGLSPALPPAQPRPSAWSTLGWVTRPINELVCAVVLLAALNQAIVELWCTGKRYRALVADLNLKDPSPDPAKEQRRRIGKRIRDFVSALTGEPDWQIPAQHEHLATITHKMRFLQGWFMFSPNPVKDDGIIVVDAITVDGRHVDPFWGEPPNFDLVNAKSFGYNQIWSDYFNRIQTAGNRAYRDSMADYLRRLPERTGNPNDKLVSGEVYWVHDFNPRFKQTKSWGQTQTLLCAFGAEGPCKDPPKDPPKKPGS